MKLKKFKETDKKRIGIIVFTITCILLVSGVILYRTFAIFEVRTNQNVIKGTVQDPGNLYFAFYYDGGIQRDMPVKDNGYVLDEEASYCGVNGSKEANIKVTLTEDYVIQVHGVTTSRTKCNLYFVKGKFIQGKGVPIVEDGDGLYEVPHSAEDTEGIDAGWQETEYRYAGASPKNYVWFNEELWRIIGLVNVKTSEETIEQRLKIIKDTPLEESKPWNSNNSNDWTQATLMTYLNTDYYHKLNSKNKSMIDEDIIWNLGGWSTSEITTSRIYFYERGTTGGFDAPEKYEWSSNNTIGTTFHSISLMYPSDYGYATSGGTKDNRSMCLTTLTIYSYDTLACKENDWLLPEEENEWLLIPHFLATSLAVVLVPNGPVNNGTLVNTLMKIRPVVYLKQNIKILNDGQDGSAEKPYHLQQIL